MVSKREGAARKPAAAKVEATPKDTSAAAEPDAPPAETPEPVPLEVPLEEQITALPPLAYPGTDTQEFDRWAAEKRHSRLRLEIIGGVFLLVAGGVASVIAARPTFLVVALFCLLGLGAYEFLVSSFE